MHEGLLFIGGVALFYLSVEIGIRLGKRSPIASDDAARSHIGTIESALLGFFALLLGFAFAMAMGRYDDRRKIIVDEANDLSTTDLRAALLPEPFQTEVRDILRKHVDSRVAFSQAQLNPESARNALRETDELQKLLWQRGVEATKVSTDEVRTGYFIETLNSLIDDHTRRTNAIQNHVPDFILLLLYFVGTTTFLMAGYS